MAYKRLEDSEFDIKFISGDTEYIRLTVKDSDGNVIDVTSSTDVVFGIKRDITDDDFIVDEIAGTLYEYDKDTQPYNIEIVVPSLTTKAILEYDNKKRKSIECIYDIELTGTEGVTTLLYGKLTVLRSISGIV